MDPSTVSSAPSWAGELTLAVRIGCLIILTWVGLLGVGGLLTAHRRGMARVRRMSKGGR